MTAEMDATGDGYRRAGLSEDRNRRDECPRCRPDRPSPDTTPDGASAVTPETILTLVLVGVLVAAVAIIAYRWGRDGRGDA